MIDFKEFTLPNGLHVIVHEAPTTNIAVLNLLYKVGSKDEDPSKTGFAHLFEHLMFGGSQNVASYDEELQKVGGENNAFTSPDITNYYVTVPSTNLETAFWLESDRMLSLSFDPNVLEIQRKVVIEEFKQRYLNQPYGDVWLKLRPLAYKTHPYQWATIGKEISHIEDATMDDVKDFFHKYYAPNNAILVVSGNVTLAQVKELTEKWFGSIPAAPSFDRTLPMELPQKELRSAHVEEDVPTSQIYMAYHMPGRKEESYHVADLLSDILGRGKSSRLHTKLVIESNIFNSISAYVTGSADPGLLVINGKLKSETTFDDARSAIEEVVNRMTLESVPDNELSKVKNKAESTVVFSEIELLNTAMNLAYSAFLGDTDLVNHETEKIQSVTSEEILQMAKKILTKENCSILEYAAK